MAWDDIDRDLTPVPTSSPLLPDDFDEIALERTLAGDGLLYDDLTSAEQQEVIRQLTERGRSIRDIAAQLASAEHTVNRRRASVDAVRRPTPGAAICG